MDNTYNGWTNWETWQILLWATNDEGLYRETTEFVNFYAWRTGFEQKVRIFFRTMFPEGTPDMDSYEEMHNVNWEEITQALLEWDE
jgi:hypothetical protein